ENAALIAVGMVRAFGKTPAAVRLLRIARDRTAMAAVESIEQGKVDACIFPDPVSEGSMHRLREHAAAVSIAIKRRRTVTPCVHALPRRNRIGFAEPAAILRGGRNGTGERKGKKGRQRQVLPCSAQKSCEN